MNTSETASSSLISECPNFENLKYEIVDNSDDILLAGFWIRKNIGRQEFADHASNQVGSRSAIFCWPKYYQGRQFSNSQVCCFRLLMKSQVHYSSIFNTQIC